MMIPHVHMLNDNRKNNGEKDQDKSELFLEIMEGVLNILADFKKVLTELMKSSDNIDLNELKDKVK